MFEIDKKKFGLFVAKLRKENHLTQKELASQLFISDKAISNWKQFTRYHIVDSSGRFVGRFCHRAFNV